jgi:hypothetical protein
MRLVLALVSSVLLALVVLPASGEASCVAMLKWDGHDYAGFGKPGDVGATLKGKATLPSCDDTSDGEFVIEPSPDKKVTVKRLRGVAPLIAITDGQAVYVNPFTFVNLPSHPLHDQLGSDRRTATTGEACTVKGRAVVSVVGLQVKDGGKSLTNVTVARDTKVVPHRHGTGYVADGARITVTGRCSGKGGIAALRIAAT